MIVSNIIGSNGRAVANQFIIKIGGKYVFQSYFSKIAVIDDGELLYVTKKWNYSATTMKYLKIFLSTHLYDNLYQTKSQFQRKIDKGEVKVK